MCHAIFIKRIILLLHRTLRVSPKINNHEFILLFMKPGQLYCYWYCSINKYIIFVKDLYFWPDIANVLCYELTVCLQIQSNSFKGYIRTLIIIAITSIKNKIHSFCNISYHFESIWGQYSWKIFWQVFLYLWNIFIQY